MDHQPLWSLCLHLSGGTCPHMLLEAAQLSGQNTPRPELSQDLALERLSQACATCTLAPGRDDAR